MNSFLRLLLLVAASGLALAACHKETTPSQANMDAEARRKAIEVREAADKEAAAIKETAIVKEAERKKAEVKEALAPGSTVPTPAPAQTPPK